MRSAIILFLFLIFTSCAKKPAEEVDEAIDLAQTYLSSNQCDKAIEVLEEVGRDKSNPVYLQVLASAYACRANYSDVSFLLEDINKINPDVSLLLSSLSIMRISPETEADSSDYQDMREALNILLDLDNSQPSQAGREDSFGVRKAGDIGVQILFLSLTQLGKFLHYYGNVGSLGEKAGGTGSNTCFIEYTYGPANAVVNATGGVCNNVSSGDGHPDLTFSSLVTTRRRLCEGLMLVTNMMDVLENMTLPTNSSMSALNDVKDTVEQFKASVTANPNLSTLINTTSQATCESLVTSDPDEWNYLQHIYAILFESGLTVGVPP